MKAKLTSRKFWLSTAAFLSSIGTTIAGITLESEWLAVVGIVCAVVSSGIYSIMEALVDEAAVNTNQE